jgi:hypothetical protein
MGKLTNVNVNIYRVCIGMWEIEGGLNINMRGVCICRLLGDCRGLLNRELMIAVQLYLNNLIINILRQSIKVYMLQILEM